MLVDRPIVPDAFRTRRLSRFWDIIMQMFDIDFDTGRNVPVLHTGLINCSTGTSIPPKVENPGSTSVVGSRD
jgi:hypothetical protein